MCPTSPPLSPHPPTHSLNTDAEQTVLVDCDAAGKADLLRLLKRYRLRQRVDIADVSDDYRVWASFGGASDAVATAAAAPPTGWAADPRLPQLGLRAVLPADAVGGGGGSDSSSWQAYRRWRIVHGVAEGDTEIPTGACCSECVCRGMFAFGSCMCVCWPVQQPDRTLLAPACTRPAPTPTQCSAHAGEAIPRV